MTRRFALSSVASLVLAAAAGIFALTPARPARAADAPSDKKPAAATFEVYKDKAGEYRWRLRMQNTKVIATSGEGYKEKESCLKAIESVKRAAVDAPVKEVEASDSGAAAKDDADAKKPASE